MTKNTGKQISWLELRIITRDKVDEMLTTLFNELHVYASTEHGDITPEQLIQLDEIQKELVNIVTEQIWQNTPSNPNYNA